MADLAIKLPPAQYLDEAPDEPLIADPATPEPTPAPAAAPRPTPDDVPDDPYDRAPVVAPTGPTIEDVTKRDDQIRELKAKCGALEQELAAAKAAGLEKLLEARIRNLGILYVPVQIVRAHGGEIKRAFDKIRSIFEQNGAAMLAVKDVSTTKAPSKIKPATNIK
jgi:hypothetical protein